MPGDAAQRARDADDFDSTDPRPSTAQSPKQESVLNASLDGRRTRPLAADDTTLALENGAGEGTMARTGASAEEMDASRKATDRIYKRHEKDVEKVDHVAHMSHVPLADRSQVKPDAKSMVVSLKFEMDGILSRAGMKQLGDGQLWEDLFNSTAHNQQMQFLEQHSRTGHFTEQYGEGGSYEGEFLYGMRHGKGIHSFRGEVYEGEWKWDQRHGWGSSKLPDGSQIRGEWESGKPHGFVTILDAKDRITFEGEFREGKRSGLGRQVYPSGDSYDGGWKLGRLHDRGIYYFANGDKFYGMWNQGVYDGVGVFKYADGSASRRVYKEGMLMSVQDYDASHQKYGRTLTRDQMLRHTRDTAFPKDTFMLNAM